MICSIRSTDVWTCSESWPMAALLTSPSMTPCELSMSATNRLQASTSVMSTEPKLCRVGIVGARR